MRPQSLTVPFHTAPLLRRGWRPAFVTLAQSAALLLPALATLGAGGPGVIAIFATALVAVGFWETAFAFLRGRGTTFHGLTTALIVAVMVPVGTPLWQIGLAASFGAVMGELIFGGRGFGLVNAGLAALAFLLFSFPGTGLSGASLGVAVACLPGAAFLIFMGFLSWRLLLGAGLGLTAVALASGASMDPTATAAAVGFGLIFLIADPATAAVTQSGRLAQGVLAGGLIVAFGGTESAAPDPGAVVFAALVAVIFAPLVDALAVKVAVVRRGRRHG